MGELLAIGADGEWEQGVCFKTGEITACLRANEIWSGEEKLMMRGEGEGKDCSGCEWVGRTWVESSVWVEGTAVCVGDSAEARAGAVTPLPGEAWAACDFQAAPRGGVEGGQVLLPHSIQQD